MHHFYIYYADEYINFQKQYIKVTGIYLAKLSIVYVVLG